MYTIKRGTETIELTDLEVSRLFLQKGLDDFKEKFNKLSNEDELYLLYLYKYADKSQISNFLADFGINTEFDLNKIDFNLLND